MYMFMYVAPVCGPEKESCNPPMFECVLESSQFNSPYTVCTRQCAFNNGGCSNSQTCVDRPFCVSCSHLNESEAWEGTCLNTDAGIYLCTKEGVWPSEWSGLNEKGVALRECEL